MTVFKVNSDTQTLELAQADNGLEATSMIGLTPIETYVKKETIELSTLVSDAAAELSISKNEVKALVQKEKIQSVLRDGHYYVNVEEIQTYLTELEDEQEADTIEEEQTTLEVIIDDISKNVFNYSGNKDSLISQIARFMPSKINTIHDRFGGSFSLGLNIQSKKKVYNELDENVYNVIVGLSKGTPEGNLKKLLAVEKEYGLEKIEFTLQGTTKEERAAERKIINAPHREKFKKLTKDFNENTDKPWEQFLILVSHSFSSRIEYDVKGNYNAPVSPPDHYLNKTLQEKILKFSEKLIALGDTVTFTNKDFSDYDIDSLTDDDVLYFDPPYINSDANYVRKLWGEEKEVELYKHLDELHTKGKKFALSNTFVHDGITNKRLVEWAKKYKVYYLKKEYKQSEKSRSGNYKTVEILVTNYGEGCNSPEVVALYEEDMKIVQGAFFMDDEVAQGNESYRLSNIADEKYKASYKEALIHKCEWLVQRINLGKSIIVFKEKYEIQKRLDRQNGIKTQSYKAAVESAYNFDYETARRAINLAIDSRIAKLKVEDILKLKLKSLDALDSLKVLTDEEFSLFMNGKHILKSTRPIAKSRQKPSKAKNDAPIEDNTLNAPDSVESADSVNISVLNQSDTSQEDVIAELRATIEKQNTVIEEQKAKVDEYERVVASNSISTLSAQNNILQESNKHSAEAFVNNTSLSDGHYKEILALDKAQLQKQHIQLASTEYLILGDSSISGFPFVMAS